MRARTRQRWVQRAPVVGTRNERAVRFYCAYGFAEIQRLSGPPEAIVFGIRTGADRE